MYTQKQNLTLCYNCDLTTIQTYINSNNIYIDLFIY